MNKEKDSYQMQLDWSHILQADDSPSANEKGLRFENLIESLLIAMNGEKYWRRTPTTHDGKKDFATPYNNIGVDTRWVECKNYSRRISINILSPTLVMSAIEDVPDITFFSYSELNDSAYGYIGQFAKAYNKKIKVFAGKRLEKLIIRHWDDMPSIGQYFPDDNIKHHLQPINNKERYHIYRQLRSFDGRTTITTKHKFEIGEKFRYIIVVHNVSERNLKLSANSLAIDEDIRVNSLETERIVLAGEVAEITSICEVVHHCKRFQLPDIAIDIDSKRQIISNGSRYSTTNVDHYFMCGESHIASLQRSLQLLGTSRELLLLVEGNSGVGKTLLIDHLMMNNDIQNNYIIVRLDGAEKLSTIHHMLKDVLFQFIGIPYKQRSIDLNSVEDQCLIKDMFYDSMLNYPLVVDYFLRLAKIKKILLIIDNTSEINSQLLRILNMLIIAIHDKKFTSSIAIMLTINTTTSTEREVLEMLNIDENYQNISKEVVRLTSFDDRDTTIYLNARHGIQNCSDFIDSTDCGYLPIHLDILVKSLADNQIIVKNKTAGYIVIDPIGFKKQLRSLSKSSAQLMKSQLAHMRRKYSSLWSEIEWCLKILLIVRNINIAVFRDINKKSISILLDYQIITDNEKTLRFRHSIIEKFYRYVIQFTSDDYISIYHALCRIGRFKYAHSILACAYASKRVDALGITTREISDLLYHLDHTIPIAESFSLCKVMMCNLKHIRDVEFINITIKFIRKCIHLFRGEIGKEDRAEFFEELKNIIISKKALSWCDCYEDLAYMMKKYMDLALSMHDNTRCIKHFEDFTKQLENFTKQTGFDRRKWEAHLHNRIAIAYDRLSSSNREDTFSAALAEYHYSECRALSRDVNDHELNLQIEIDEFNRHYAYMNDQNTAFAQTFLDFCNQYSYALDMSDLKVRYHVFLAKFLLNEAIDIHDIDKIIENRISSDSSFYVQKIMLLRIYYYLHRGELAQINAYLNELQEYAYSCQSRSSIYKITYIKAQVSRLLSADKLSVLNMFLQAYYQFSDNMRYSKEFFRNEYMYIEMLSAIEGVDSNKVEGLIRNDPVAASIYQEYKKHSSTKNYHEFSWLLQTYFKFYNVCYPRI